MVRTGECGDAGLVMLEGLISDPARSRHRLNEILKKIETAMSRPLRVGVFGEPQTGTSALINLLLQDEILPSGRFGTSQPLIHIRYGVETSCFLITDKDRSVITRKAMLAALTGDQDGVGAMPLNVVYKAKMRLLDIKSGTGVERGRRLPVIEIRLPDRRLQKCEFVEVPLSLNLAIDTLSTRNAIRSIDFALFATLANQAWKRTEFEAWKRFGPPQRTKSVLALIAKQPLGPDDENKLSERIGEETIEWFKNFIHVPLSKPDSVNAGGGTQAFAIYELKRLIGFYLNEIDTMRRRKALTLIEQVRRKLEADREPNLRDKDSALKFAFVGIDPVGTL